MRLLSLLEQCGEVAEQGVCIKEQERDNQRVQTGGLGERVTDDHGSCNSAGSLGLSADSLNSLARAETFTETRAKDCDHC